MITIPMSDDREDYSFRCVVSGKETQLASHLYRVPFYSEKFRILFEEWTSTKDYGKHDDEELMIHDGVPGFHEKDPYTMHRLKYQFFQLLNDPSQFKIESMVGIVIDAIEKAYNVYIKWFMRDSLFKAMLLYQEELSVNHDCDSDVLKSIKSNTILAINKIGVATVSRYNDWRPHMEQFIKHWRSVYI
jgi:hypothetical protein